MVDDKQNEKKNKPKNSIVGLSKICQQIVWIDFLLSYTNP